MIGGQEYNWFIIYIIDDDWTRRIRFICVHHHGIIQYVAKAGIMAQN